MNNEPSIHLFFIGVGYLSSLIILCCIAHEWWSNDFRWQTKTELRKLAIAICTWPIWGGLSLYLSVLALVLGLAALVLLLPVSGLMSLYEVIKKAREQ